LLSELQRRNVFRVGAAYAIVAWLMIVDLQEPLREVNLVFASSGD